MTSIRKHSGGAAASATTATTATTATRDDGSGRIALIGLFVVLALLFASVRLLAQDAPSRGAIRPFAGAFIPTGDQRDFLKDAVLVGVQASWNVHPNFGLTTTFGWTPSKDRVSPGDQTIDALQFDLGAEARAPQWIGTRSISPFIGAGAGSRTYSYRDLTVDSKTNVDGYGAVGLDVIAGPVSLRIEGRDYVSQFKPLTGTGKTVTRNDVAIMAGLGLHF